MSTDLRNFTSAASITASQRKRPGILANVEARLLLVHFILENLDLTGTHIGCDVVDVFRAPAFVPPIAQEARRSL